MTQALKVSYRTYRCTCCGHKKPISTNHRGSCFDHCPGCSWKAFYKGEENSFPMPGHRHGRLFEFVSDEVTCLGYDHVNGCAVYK